MLLEFLVNSTIMAFAVLIHYEVLHQLSSILPRIHVTHHFKVIIGVFGALIAHLMEIWLFAFAYFLMINSNEWGSLEGNFTGTLFDCVYYSFITYTTLGFGDIIPQGPVRFLTGIEALTGLVLITWSASFLYIEMRKFWDGD